MNGQRIAITGSSGLIGGALSAYLRERGDTVIRLVRRPAVPPFEIRMPAPGAPAGETGALITALADVDAIVNLAGAGVAEHRWSDSYKQVLRASRLDTTQILVSALEHVERPLRFVSGSAIGYYADRADAVLDESSEVGEGFLAELTAQWEEVASAARGAQHSVATARTGLVVSAQGGAFKELARPARLGLAGPLGSGRQWWSWISLRDEVRALAFLLDHPHVEGPVNLVAPRASRQKDLASALGRSLRRPAVLPLPQGLLSAFLGEMSSQILASTRVRPRVLEDEGFTWLDANQDQTLDRLAHDLTRRSTR